MTLSSRFEALTALTGQQRRGQRDQKRPWKNGESAVFAKQVGISQTTEKRAPHQTGEKCVMCIATCDS